MIIYVPEDVIDRLNSQLQRMPEMIPDVLRKTINDTAKTTRREIATQAQKIYTVKTGTFNKSMKIENATQKYPQATIHTEGSPTALYGFKRHKNIGSTAAKAQVLTAGSLKELISRKSDIFGKDIKAFVQTTKNGHTGIFQRMTFSERMKSTSKKRNAIKQLYAPSIPQMVGNEKRVYSEVQPFIAEELRKNLEKHIAAVMEGIV